MEMAKNIFFFIGSILGILAFIKGMIDPVFERNRQKWEKVKEHLTEKDLIDLQYEIYVRRLISTDVLYRVMSLVSDFRQEAEYTRFGPFLKSEFLKRQGRFIQLYDSLKEYIQVPYWEPTTQEIEDGEQANYWTFNKDYWDSEYKGDYNDYTQHLRKASDIADEMRIEYRAMSLLANVHSFELPFASRMAKRASRLPSG